MNNPALELPNPVKLRNPSRSKQEGLDHEEWYIPSGSSVTASVDIDDDPVSIAFNPEGLIRRLRRRYEFRDDEAVREFLREKQFLIRLLFSARKEIRDVFGAVPGLALRVIAEPEALEERELFLFIQTKLHPRAARPLLDELSRKWWLDAMLEARGEMNISLEYV